MIDRFVYVPPEVIDRMYKAGSKGLASFSEPGAGDFEESPAIKATRNALFARLEGMFSPDNTNGTLEIPAILGQQRGAIKIISHKTEQQKPITSISTGIRSFKIVAHPEGQSPIEILSINPYRALNKNLGRMTLEELNRMSLVIEDIAHTLPPKNNLTVFRR